MRTFTRASISVATVGLSICLVAGCAAPKKPSTPAAPRFETVELDTSYYSGSLYGDSNASSPKLSPGEDVARIEISGLQVTPFPWSALEPAAAQSRVMTDRESGALLTARFEHASQTRVGKVADLDKLLDSEAFANKKDIASVSAVAPLGVTTVLRIRVNEQNAPVEIHLHRTSADAVSADLALASSSNAAASVVLASSLSTSEPLAVVVPLDDQSTRAAALKIRISAGPKQGSAVYASHTQALERCVKSLDEESETEIEGFAGKEAAIYSLRSAWNRRPTLVFLSSQSNAALTEELALAASDRALSAISKAVVEGFKQREEKPQSSKTANPALEEEHARPKPLQGDALGIFLESASIRALRSLKQKGDWSSDLTSILVRHVGELANHPGVLVTMLPACPTMDAFRQRVATENLIFLEDNSAAARERAHAWLSTRNLAPESFDPQAPRAARREALAKHAAKISKDVEDEGEVR